MANGTPGTGPHAADGGDLTTLLDRLEGEVSERHRQLQEAKKARERPYIRYTVCGVALIALFMGLAALRGGLSDTWAIPLTLIAVASLVLGVGGVNWFHKDYKNQLQLYYADMERIHRQDVELRASRKGTGPTAISGLLGNHKEVKAMWEAWTDSSG